jgi:hypothetical protein
MPDETLYRSRPFDQLLTAEQETVQEAHLKSARTEGAKRVRTEDSP